MMNAIDFFYDFFDILFFLGSSGIIITKKMSRKKKEYEKVEQ